MVYRWCVRRLRSIRTNERKKKGAHHFAPIHLAKDFIALTISINVRAKHTIIFLLLLLLLFSVRNIVCASGLRNANTLQYCTRTNRSRLSTLSYASNANLLLFGSAKIFTWKNISYFLHKHQLFLWKLWLLYAASLSRRLNLFQALVSYLPRIGISLNQYYGINKKNLLRNHNAITLQQSCARTTTGEKWNTINSPFISFAAPLSLSFASKLYIPQSTVTMLCTFL